MPGANNEETDKTKNGAGAGGNGAAGEGGNPNPDDSGAGGDPTDDELEGFADPVKAKAEIKRLRAENAKHRTKSKALETELGGVKATIDKMKKALGLEDEADPAEQVATLKQQNEALQVEMAMSELCREHEIPRQGEKYFKFLVAQEFETLSEGEEISDERVLELAGEAKKMFAANGNSGTGTGVNPGQKPPPSGNNESTSVADFVKMNNGEKSELYIKNPNLYQKLFDEAKQKRLI